MVTQNVFGVRDHNLSPLSKGPVVSLSTCKALQGDMYVKRRDTESNLPRRSRALNSGCPWL